jgi:hypothetical protein
MTNQDTSHSDKEPRPHQVTLAEFVEENQKLITVLGVFTALTIFSSNLSLKPFAHALSFMFMTLSVLLWLELWGKYPSSPGNWTLTWFENILFLTVLAFIAYWLIAFRDIWDKLLAILLFGLILAPFSWLLKKYNIFNRLFRTQPGKLRPLRYLFGIAIGLAVLYFSLQLAYVVASPVNRVLDSFYQAMQTPNP